MEQEMPGHSETDQENPQEQQGEDPLAALGQGVQALVEGIQQSQLPDEVKKQAGVVQQDFEQLVSMIGGGAQQGPQPMSGNEAMGGGNPNAQAVR